MNIHQVKRNTPQKKSKLVGRGGKRGKTSGKGTKGQKARSGRKIRPEIRDIIKKIPKLRGRGMNINTPRKAPFVTIGLSQINEAFDSKERVTTQSLFEKNLYRKVNGKFPNIKITNGEISKKLTFKGVKFTEEAKKAVEKAGGEIK